MSDASDVSIKGSPVWATIADLLRREIAEGARRPGDRLPTEARLAARFGVNRHTVRRALAALVEEGLVRTRRGSGAFVAEAPTEYPIGARTRFRRSMEAAGRVPGKRLLSLETRPATAEEAAPLCLTPGDAIHVAEGIALADGAPVALFRSTFPAARLPGLPGALARDGSVTDALRACGVADYVRVSTRITAAAADPVEAGHLHLEPGAPLLVSEAINADLDGTPVEAGTTRFAGTRIALTLHHP
ncbi:phosphonate metabolism transcriptional regulator PhnF [Jannaschia seohaensis]|uniref:GntR family phosphonate transport system transcriptional regulator n=1 Tax=Jannaschia seohaensis TaxID=475081 RepID=A0A2Y9A136_9RHOB|nr:phosphonate metabolism transcriptional regulator PhnF [Jannaschia seohaensis]PWJ21882.1 GntR family phosphonate transport system transcriptional regulator [Jannaschia seohaensis]SSA38160.1 GntR family transcriptional regulator, phosphonate transport system regulatory protein [Jannaschia seohaensis]